MTRLTSYLLATALAFSLAACAAYERADEASRARRQVIGMHQAELRQCAGPPRRREARSENEEVWIYQSSEDQGVRRGPDLDEGASGRLGLPGGSEVIPERYCVARITMRGQRVADVQYKGMTGGMFSKGEQCAFILGDCAR